MKNLTDEELMTKVANDQLDAMRILYGRYHEWIFNFFVQMIQNQDNSEDLTQTTFYKAIKYRKSYKGGKFNSWIFRIARNLCSDYFKSAKKITYYEDMDKLDVQMDEPYQENEESKLKLAMQRLPPDDREILILSRFQGKRYHEIAEILGTTQNAVKIKAHRAIRKLKNLFFESIET